MASFGCSGMITSDSGRIEFAASKPNSRSLASLGMAIKPRISGQLDEHPTVTC
jgi:hypothetical protein